jgi:HlyD family secretion protein
LETTMTSIPDPALPLAIISNEGAKAATKRIWFRPLYLLILLVPVFMFSGAVLGMYFQPPGLQKFYSLTGLQPGGGSASPIAVPPEIILPNDMAETMRPSDVLGLARLMPRGDISIVAPPYGAGDARVAEILVAEGDLVTKGTVVARLDSEAQLTGVVLLAEANLAVRQASLVQTRTSVENSRNEAQAGLVQARSVAAEAATALSRAEQLSGQGVATKAALDAARAADLQARALVARAEATLARFTAAEVDDQPDVLVAIRNLEASQAELARARNDLIRAAVVAPIDGTILNIHASLGQRPPAEGIMEMGNTSQMMAEAEIYQDRIMMVAKGQPVELAAAALGRTLQGRIVSLGLTVGRQGLLADDTAANTDARVVRVMVELDDASSAIAARFTNLEVIARIDTNSKSTAKP